MWKWVKGSDWMCLRDAEDKVILLVEEEVGSIGMMPSDEHAKLIATAGMIPELVELLREFVNHNPADWVMQRSKKVLAQIEEVLK